MSIRNERTGRHEDDLAAAAFQNDGQVTLRELLEHLEEVVVGSGHGANVEQPVAALCKEMRELVDGMGSRPKYTDLVQIIAAVPRCICLSPPYHAGEAFPGCPVHNPRR